MSEDPKLHGRARSRDRGIFEKEPDSGVWWVRYTDANGRLHREKVGSKGLARKVYEKRKTEVREGRFFPEQVNRKETPLGDQIDDYLKRKEGILRHFRHYKRIGRYWKEALGSRALRSLTPSDVESYAARRIKEVSRATTNRELAFLKRIFNDAIQNDKADANPVVRVKLFKENNARVRFLTAEEEDRLRGKLTPEHWNLVAVALNTGLRQSEQFNLRWSDVDFATGIITIPRSKNGEVRRLPMNDTVRDILRGLPSRMRGEYVFPNKAGKPMSPDNFINRYLRPALERTDIRDFHWHDCRHTFASRLVMKGVPLTTVKELMGHKTIQMTLRYSHLAPDHLLEAVQRLTSTTTDTRAVAKPQTLTDTSETAQTEPVCKTSIQRFESARRLQVPSSPNAFHVALALMLGVAIQIAPARADTYGAIAFSDQTGYYAWSVDQGSAKGAETRALSSCTQKGAGCKIVVSFSHSCGALAVGDNNRFAAGQANNSSDAKSIAMNACRVATGDGRCDIRAAYCINPPDLNAKPGLWQLTSDAGDQAGAAGKTAASATSNRCIKPAEVASHNWLPLFDASAADATCNRIDFNASSDSIHWKFNCSVVQKTTEGSIRFDTPEHYAGTLSSKTTGSANSSSTVQLNGKWIGPCAAAN